MRFGRLNGFVTEGGDGQRWITVMLDTGKDVRTIRDEPVPEAFAHHDAEWLADQLVQETLGTDLAEEGWEVIGQGESDATPDDAAGAIARSPTWIVRKT